MFLAFDGVNLFLCRFDANHEIMSCVMPKGQIIEQYMRPQTRVNMAKKIIITALTAINAGMNCIFAIQPM